MYTWQEAAVVTGLSEKTLQRFARNGELRVCHFGVSTRIRHVDLEQFAEDHLQ
jgi:excisionase family DNA binding protein|tara:strand:+ start:3061 stop:3219 length:159 start_codon:yes stop_codon:yes gene_type:complete